MLSHNHELECIDSLCVELNVVLQHPTNAPELLFLPPDCHIKAVAVVKMFEELNEPVLLPFIQTVAE